MCAGGRWGRCQRQPRSGWPFETPTSYTLTHLREVLGLAGSAAGDDGDGDRVRHRPHELQVEALLGAVVVDAVQQDLARPQGLDRLGQLDRADVAPLPPALHRALPPAVLLARWPRLGRLDGGVLRLSLVVSE